MAGSALSAITPPFRFLVVEDEPDIARLLQLHLSDLQADVEICEDGREGLQRASDPQLDLLILDLQLPGVDGLDICRAVRASGLNTPLLMLTSRGSELDRVLGLELGADDYLTKPFSMAELKARSKALLRRHQRQSLPQSEGQAADECLLRHHLKIWPDQRRVMAGDSLLELTAREFDLLLFFCQHPGKVFRRSELLDKVWGYGHEGYEHTVNSHINRLRAKVEADASQPRLIETVWGVGYRLAETPPPATALPAAARLPA